MWYQKYLELIQILNQVTIKPSVSQSRSKNKKVYDELTDAKLFT